MYKYLALDFETANNNYLSACSIGAVIFTKYGIENTFESFIKPPSNYDHLYNSNFRVHKIKKHQYMNAPSFPSVWTRLERDLNIDECIIVCHNSGFDINILKKMFTHYNIRHPKFYYLDSVNIGKLTWNTKDYKLSTISSYLKIDLNHHDALSDAKACAEITIRSLKKYNAEDFDQILEKSRFGYGVLSNRLNVTMGSSKIKKINKKNKKVSTNKINSFLNEKYCINCKKIEPIGNFSLDARTVDGFSRKCKVNKSQSSKDKNIDTIKKAKLKIQNFDDSSLETLNMHNEFVKDLNKINDDKNFKDEEDFIKNLGFWGLGVSLFLSFLILIYVIF